MRPFYEDIGTLVIVSSSAIVAYRERVDIVALGEEVQGVGNEDDGLALIPEGAQDGVGEESLSDMSIDW